MAFDERLLVGVSVLAAVVEAGSFVRAAEPLGLTQSAVEVPPDWQDERFPLYALYPSRRLPAAKLRVFLDFVVELTRALSA